MFSRVKLDWPLLRRLIAPAPCPWNRLFGLLLPLLLVMTGLLSGCALPRVTAEQRLFLDLSLELLGEYRIPKTPFEATPVGGLSAITYDRRQDRFYVVSDDRSQNAPARFYTLSVKLAPTSANQSSSKQGWIQSVQVEKVTFLRQENGETYAPGTLDPEGIALTPQGTVFVSSEGVSSEGIAPFIREFDLTSGKLLKSLPIPNRYLPKQDETGVSGVRDNVGFEALTVNPGSYNKQLLEPFRLFVATESALAQDEDNQVANQGAKARLLHYLIGDGPPLLVSEHAYPVDPVPSNAKHIGLTELLSLDQGGHFLAIERFYGGQAGLGAKIYQVATGGATDTSSIVSLKGVEGVRPAQKQLLLDLQNLNMRLDNLEGLALGPRLPDGSESLWVLSDDNFGKAQVNQLLLFRLKRGK